MDASGSCNPRVASTTTSTPKAAAKIRNLEILFSDFGFMQNVLEVARDRFRILELGKAIAEPLPSIGTDHRHERSVIDIGAALGQTPGHAPGSGRRGNRLGWSGETNRDRIEVRQIGSQ